MKKLLSFFIIIVLCSAFILFNGCDKDTVINNPVTSTKGIFVLYEGAFGQPSSYDYGFIDLTNDTVYGNVFQNSNSGATLNSFPDGMLLHSDQFLYITAQGSFGQQGTIYKINSTTNTLVDTLNFGKNPYTLYISNGKIFVTNVGGSSVSVLDMNLNLLVDSIGVGPFPSEIAYGNGKIYTAKSNYSFENSLAIINEASLQVTKIFLPSLPVGVAFASGNAYTVSYLNKMVYKIDGSSNQVVDSVSVSTTFPALGDIVNGDNSTLYISTFDTATFSYREIYKYDIASNTATLLIPDAGGSNDIYGVAYDAVEQRLYVGNTRGGLINGEVKVYDRAGTLVKTYSDIGGKYPNRFAFKY